MIVERSLHPQFLSNTYLVADGEGGPAFFVDAGGPVEPLVRWARANGLEPTHVLLTHHHHDHVSEVGALLEQWPSLRVLIDPAERELVERATGSIEAGERLRFGTLELRPLHTPGHTVGGLSFIVGRTAGEGRGGSGPGGWGGEPASVFTGDTLFRGSVGGVRAPHHGTYTALRDSIMGTLMELPRDTVVLPGHTDVTRIGEEWERNPFIRIWRGLDPEGGDPCMALGEPATLILMATDYDGGHKAWVRWPNGSDDILPGSQVHAGTQSRR